MRRTRFTAVAAAAALLVSCGGTGDVPEEDAPYVAGLNLRDADSLITDAGYTTHAQDIWPVIQETVFNLDMTDDFENPLRTERSEWLVLGQCTEPDGDKVTVTTVRIADVPEPVHAEIDAGAFDEDACAW